jgi:xanthine dehydrogenase accessory factor
LGKSLSIWREIVELESNNQGAVLCTIIRSQGSVPRHAGSKMLVYADGGISGTIGGGELEGRIRAAAIEALQTGKTRVLEFNMSDPERGDPGVCGGQVEIYMEPIIPQPTLVIVGAGHVGRAVAYLANWLGFRLVISDDRQEFLEAEDFPQTKQLIHGRLEDLTDQLKITQWTYIVLTTRSVDVDVPGLPQILDSPAAYIGVIGSKRRWETTRQKLLEAGVGVQKIDQVKSPIGLEIAAETPEEIALSIMAEIIQIRRSSME